MQFNRVVVSRMCPASRAGDTSRPNSQYVSKQASKQALAEHAQVVYETFGKRGRNRDPKKVEWSLYSVKQTLLDSI